jgi:hypothetical protein
MQLTRMRLLPDQLVGYSVLVDRAKRPTFQQEDGRQYIIGFRVPP